MLNRLTLPLADWVGVASLNQAGDVQLLHRFSQLGEQQAFTVLVKRHGPMVWGVIRRLLRNHQDAEDAFQATFLVLSRKAASLRNPHLLAAWLHGVAHRTALQLRSRRKLTVTLDAEHEVMEKPSDDLAWRDCGRRIDHAIEQLPMRLRIVFLLCQAEGLTTLAASRRLSLPEGTVVSRLHYARKQLQGLLARHGITSAAGAVAACWSLVLPETLSAFTVRSLLGSAPSALVAGLAQGVITTMMWIKVSTAAVFVSTIGLVGAGAATIMTSGPGDKVAQQVGVAQPPSKNDSKDARIRQLEDQLDEARKLDVRLRQQMEAMALKAKLMEDQMVQSRMEQERQAKVLVDREAVLRKQIDMLEQKSKDVQQFLEKSIIAQDVKAKEKVVQEDLTRRNEDLVREKKEKVRQEDLARRNEEEARLKLDERRRQDQLQAVRDAQVNQERRHVYLKKAKEQLVQDIDGLQKEYDQMEAEMTTMQIASEQEVQRRNADIEAIEEELAKEMRRAEVQPNTNTTEKINALRVKRNTMLREAKLQSLANVRSSFTNAKDRVQAQLKLRNKLLLEIDEKLLRMQLKLDEK